MNVIDQAIYDVLKKRNDQLFATVRVLLEAIRSSDDRDHFSEQIEAAEKILAGDMGVSPDPFSPKEEELRLAYIRIDKLQRRFIEVVEAKFQSEDQRQHFEAAWNYLYNEFGQDMVGVTGTLMKHFYLVPRTPDKS